MTKKEFVELVIEERDKNIYRRLPGGKNISFFANPKKERSLTVTPEYETLWAEVRTWLEGGAYPAGLEFDMFRSFQDELENGLREVGTSEVHDLAFKILKDISGETKFNVLYIPIGELQAMGWTFEKYLAASLREDHPKRFTTIPDRFAHDAVETWPDETAAWAAEVLKGPRVDSGDSPYIRAIRSAMALLIRDAKKYERFQDQVDTYVRESYQTASESRRHIVMNFCHRYRAASAEIHKIIRDIMEKNDIDLIYGGAWGGICDDLKLPDYSYPVLIAKDIAWTPEIGNNKYVPETEYFKDLLKNERDRFMHSYEKLLVEKEPFVLRLLKILHVFGDAAGDAAKEKLAALNAGSGTGTEPDPSAAAAFWQQLETIFAKDRSPIRVESLAAVCDICPRAQALYASILDADRQRKKKKESSSFNQLIDRYFVGREESRYGEKSNVIFDEMISNKLISAGEFFTAYSERKDVPAEVLDYALKQYSADAEAFTAKAGKILETEKYLDWLTIAGTRIRPIAYVPVLAASSKKAVDIAEKYILTAGPADKEAIVEAVNALMPNLKTNGASAAARILARFKAR